MEDRGIPKILWTLKSHPFSASFIKTKIDLIFIKFQYRLFRYLMSEILIDNALYLAILFEQDIFLTD